MARLADTQAGCNTCITHTLRRFTVTEVLRACWVLCKVDTAILRGILLQGLGGSKILDWSSLLLPIWLWGGYLGHKKVIESKCPKAGHSDQSHWAALARFKVTIAAGFMYIHYWLSTAPSHYSPSLLCPYAWVQNRTTCPPHSSRSLAEMPYRVHNQGTLLASYTTSGESCSGMNMSMQLHIQCTLSNPG